MDMMLSCGRAIQGLQGRSIAKGGTRSTFRGHPPRENLRVTASLPTALTSETIVLAVPSFAMAETLQVIAPFTKTGKVFINLAKGLDRSSRRTMSELIEEAVDARAVFTLSGPSHAEEVGQDIPTAVVLAGSDLTLGKELQLAVASARFRIYLTDDIRGVELCATVKNIIALATGISDGLDMGITVAVRSSPVDWQRWSALRVRSERRSRPSSASPASGTSSPPAPASTAAIAPSGSASDEANPSTRSFQE